MVKMMIDRSSMDLVLVPCGLVVMLGYHLLLLYRVLRHPHTTVIGYENHNKLAWVERMMQQTTTPAETALALSVISDNISASTTLASLCIALGSLIGAWVSGTGSRALMAGVIYGDASDATATVKFISLLVCFLASFTCFIQSARHYVHASFLLSTLGSDVPASYVQRAVLRGGNFWAAGLRALYLATALLMWVFGPVPMLACSLLTVAVLYPLDANSVPLHHHRFTAKNKAQGRGAAPPLQPCDAAVLIAGREARASAPNPALSSTAFSPFSYVS